MKQVNVIKQYKGWHIFYVCLMIAIYGFYVPGSLLLWFTGIDGFPYQIIVAIFAVHFVKKQHMKFLRER